jgi:hypothetical protein
MTKGTIMAENQIQCSRCEETKLLDEFSKNEPGEIAWCNDCEGVCRMCGTTDCSEEELEHGLCLICCMHLDEQAEEEENPLSKLADEIVAQFTPFAFLCKCKGENETCAEAMSRPTLVVQADTAARIADFIREKARATS